MISSVSSNQPVAAVQTAQAAKTQAPAPAAQKEDSVQLSAQAKAALSGGDVDHDGDSH